MRTCLFCRGPASGQGEHVLPQWLLSLYDQDDPPFTLEVNGVPEKTSQGTVKARAEISRMMLREVCRDCNTWLNDTFEEPARQHVATLLGPEPVLDADGARRVAEWATKTLLLLAHPHTERTGFKTQGPAGWANFQNAWLADLRTQHRFPDSMSLWVAVHDPSAANELADPGTIILGTTYRDLSTGGGRGEVNEIGFGADGGRTVEFQLVHHPLCVFTHPFEEAGLAIRLWPNPPSGVDLRTLPALNNAGCEQWSSVFAVGGSRRQAPPGRVFHLAADPNLMPPLCTCALSTEVRRSALGSPPRPPGAPGQEGSASSTRPPTQ